MSHFFPVTTARNVVSAAVTVLATGGIVAGLVTASAAAQPLPAKPPPINHQLCYRATAKGFKIPKGVILKNALSPTGFKPRITAVAFHCNPVQKSIQGGATFKITNPLAHLLCFNLTAPPQKPQHLVFAPNQFGQADLIVGQPNLLCLPSWKRLTGPPGEKLPQPPGLSHFTCYPVKVQQGAYSVPKGIMLRDQFARRPVAVGVSNLPAELCVPTQKIIGKHVTRIINPAMYLVCFPVSRTPVRPKVFDQNQFGTGVVHIIRTSSLCLPSQAKVLH